MELILFFKTNKNKVCIVAGNGPSLAEIDYERLPLQYDVFRCNQFYFEDKYYLGKNIKAVTFATQMFAEQIYTTLHLNNNNEYNIESIFIPNHHILPKNQREIEMESFIKIFKHECFIHKMYDGKYSHNIEAFLEYIKIQKIFFAKHPTSAIFLCGIAVAMGYKEIYLVGIDFYEGRAYAFDTLQENVLKLMPDFRYVVNGKNLCTQNYHSKEVDLEALTFLSKHYKVRFYSLCPNSPMTQYYPLAKITKNTFLPSEKQSNYTKDVLIPNRYDRERMIKQNNETKIEKITTIIEPPPPVINVVCECNKKDNTKNEEKTIKRNIYFKIFSDFFRLPSDILHYFKHSKKG